MIYQVWFMRPEWFRDGICGEQPDRDNLAATHVHVRDVECDSLEGVFRTMQGEVWSPNGEARALIHQLGLRHTSMSVGDVAVNTATDVACMVDRIGFTRLGEEN